MSLKINKNQKENSENYHQLTGKQNVQHQLSRHADSYSNEANGFSLRKPKHDWQQEEGKESRFSYKSIGRSQSKNRNGTLNQRSNGK